MLNSNLVNLGNIQVGNYASAASDMIGVTSGGLLTALSGPATAGADIGGLGSALATDVGPAAGAAALPAAEWARHRCWPRPARVVDRWNVGPAQLGRGRRRNPGGKHARHAGVAKHADGARPEGCQTGSPGTMAGMPAVANGGRGSGSSFGAPRYGLKPKVMPAIPKPTLTTATRPMLAGLPQDIRPHISIDRN